MHRTDDPSPVRLAAAGRWPSAVPSSPGSPLIGREEDLATLRRLAAPGDHRLLTLVGTGGVGKSRLAVEIATVDLEAWRGRIAFVSLDGVADGSLVLPAIAGALGVTDDPVTRSILEAVADALGPDPTLLILDTVEHVRAAAPALADLWVRAPGLTILATSRIALGLPREGVVPVEPLPVVPATETDADVVVHSPAVALFLDRARDVRPELELTPATALIAADICRRLDGIPLAIELAAAALRVLAPHQLATRLERELGGRPDGGSMPFPTFEVGAARDGPEIGAPGRQRSLRAAMDWSLGLLPEPVRGLYRRIAVIAGPFSVATAGAILEGGLRRGLAPLEVDVRDGLEQLVAASMLHRDRDGVQYLMLGTVRADARDRLARSGEAIAMRWAHAYHLLTVVEAAERVLSTASGIEALEQLDEALDDLREALDWATEAEAGAFVVRLAGSLAEFWRTRGHHTEGRLRLAAALAIGGSAPAADRRRALTAAGMLASYQGDYALGESYLREALALARSEGDPEAQAATLNALGSNAYWRGDLAAAEPLILESLVLRRAIGDPAGIAATLNALGGVRHFRGDLDEARQAFTESLSLKQGLGSANTTAIALSNLGLVERDAGRPEAAIEALTEAVAIWERAGDRQRLSLGIHSLAMVALDQGRLDEAAEGLVRAYDLARGLGDRMEMAYAMADLLRVQVLRGDLGPAGAALAASLPSVVAMGARIIVPLALEGAGSLAAALREDELAVRLWGAASAERAASGYANMPADERLLAPRVDEVRRRLQSAAFEAAWAEGMAMSTAQAARAAMALAETPGVPRGDRPPGAPGGGSPDDDGPGV